MPLNKPDPPLAVQRAFVEGLPKFTHLRDLGGSPGQQIFTLGLKDIASGLGIDRAQAVGWRFLGGDAMGLAVAGHVKSSDGNRPPALTGLSHGPEIGDHLRAARLVESLLEVQTNDYELRVLLIPGLLMEAFWLKARGNWPDLVVLFRKASTHLEYMKAYPAGPFLDLARPWALERLKFQF